ncbi:MAG: hypothetical protein LLF74_03535 [Bacteroidales bacterium]|nr:hypothetical protein [Bacteroidales bacterium]
MKKETGQTECCQMFDPAPWDGKILEWDNKKFVKDKVCTWMYMPLDFGRVIKRIMKKVESAGAKPLECMCLSDHTSKWNMDIYVEVDDVVTGVDNVMISGKFLSKVYEGNFKDTGKWCKNFEEYAQSQSLKISKWYMWYTTCPKCSKKFGKNYVVILGQVS